MGKDRLIGNPRCKWSSGEKEKQSVGVIGGKRELDEWHKPMKGSLGMES